MNSAEVRSSHTFIYLTKLSHFVVIGAHKNIEKINHDLISYKMYINLAQNQMFDLFLMSTNHIRNKTMKNYYCSRLLQY
jgi:hypothetical protein